MQKETFYFSHDYNARTDKNIKRLLVKHGMLGYGIFWAIVEDLYNNANALPTDYDCIAHDLHTDSELIKSIITGFDLFEINDGIFSSSSVERRLNERNEKSAKARKSASYRWGKTDTDANALQTQSKGNAIKERKGNEKKGNEKIIQSPPPAKKIETESLPQNHETFAEKIFSPENILDLNNIAIQRSPRTPVTRLEVAQFNAHLHTESKTHTNYAAWKSHLRSWLNTKPPDKKPLQRQISATVTGISTTEDFKNSKTDL